jgi:pyruvate kinase
MELRRTKILATIGPACDSPELLREIFQSGVTACRLNFSHGTHDDHALRIAKIRKVAQEEGLAIPLVIDLCGPKVRTDTNTYEIKEGETWNLVPNLGDAASHKIGISHPTLYKLVPPGQPIVLDDGKLELVTVKVVGDEIVTLVKTGGTLKSRKAVNTPDCDNGLDVLSEKDRKDLVFGRDQNLDWIAVSFVRNGADLERVREYLKEIDWPGIPLIAKIETPLAVASLEEIVKTSEGVMVARGDMGIECPIETVPLVQKRIVSLTHRYSKLCVVATQMLDSMERNPRPTRAEASDVANAVFEGTQAVMLSGETAGGLFPVRAVQTMDHILRGAESASDIPSTLPEIVSQTQEVAAGAVRLAEHTNAPIIVIFGHTLETAREVASFHSSSQVIAASTDERLYRQTAMLYGVTSLLLPQVGSIDEVISKVISDVLARDFAKSGDRIVFLHSQPFGSPHFNTIRLVQVP